MKKTYSREELIVLAKPTIEQYGVNRVYATADGQMFLLENRAQLHAGKGVVYEIHTDEAGVSQEEEPAAELTVKEIEKAVKETADLDLLAMMLSDEVAGKNRKTAVQAITERMDELNATDV